MAKQTNPNSETQQEKDVLLVYDKKTKSVDVLKNSPDKKGFTPKPLKEDDLKQNDLFHVDKHADFIENFIKNFKKQYKDPTQFVIFKVPVEELPKFAKELKKSAETGKISKNMEKRQITLDELAKEKTEKQSQAENVPSGETQKTQKTQEQQETQKAPSKPENAVYLDENGINWKPLEDLGITKDSLKERGQLDTLLSGRKTELLLLKGTVAGVKFNAMAKLQLRNMEEGSTRKEIITHFPRKSLDLDRPYFGYTFTDEDKKNLLETGSLGKVVTLVSPKNNEHFESYIGLDRELNQLVPLRAANVKFYSNIKGVELTSEQMNNLKNGKKIFVENMTSGNGKTFSAFLQVDPVRGGIGYTFPEEKIDVNEIKSIGKAPLTQEQREALINGETIFVENMSGKRGLFNADVRFNFETGKLDMSNFENSNQQSNEQSNPIKGIKNIYEAELTKAQQTAIENGETIFVKGMKDKDGFFDGNVQYNFKNDTFKFSNRKYYDPKMNNDANTQSTKNSKGTDNTPKTTNKKSTGVKI